MELRRLLLRAESWASQSDGRLPSSEGRKVAIHVDCWVVDRILEADFFNTLGPFSEPRKPSLPTVEEPRKDSNGVEPDPNDVLRAVAWSPAQCFRLSEQGRHAGVLRLKIRLRGTY